MTKGSVHVKMDASTRCCVFSKSDHPLQAVSGSMHYHKVKINVCSWLFLGQIQNAKDSKDSLGVGRAWGMLQRYEPWTFELVEKMLCLRHLQSWWHVPRFHGGFHMLRLEKYRDQSISILALERWNKNCLKPTIFPCQGSKGSCKAFDSCEDKWRRTFPRWRGEGPVESSKMLSYVVHCGWKLNMFFVFGAF